MNTSRGPALMPVGGPGYSSYSSGCRWSSGCGWIGEAPWMAAPDTGWLWTATGTTGGAWLWIGGTLCSTAQLQNNVLSECSVAVQQRRVLGGSTRGMAAGMDGALLPLAVGNSSIDIISSSMSPICSLEFSAASAPPCCGGHWSFAEGPAGAPGFCPCNRTRAQLTSHKAVRAAAISGSWDQVCGSVNCVCIVTRVCMCYAANQLTVAGIAGRG